MTSRAVGIAGAVALALSVAASPAVAQTTPDTKDALKCQAGQTGTSAKFIAAKAKCAMKCLKTARKTSGPYTDCQPPYGGETLTCITDPVKGAEAKARAKIGKLCVADCPDCYADDSPSNCPDGEGFVANAEAQVDAIGPVIFCVEAGGNTPTKEEAKCEDTVAKSLVKLVKSGGKCITKCIQNEFNAKIPAGSCDAGGPSDVKTQECLDKAAAKSTASIDKACVTAPGNPSCYGSGLDSGAEWTAAVQGLLAAAAPNTYCGP